MTSALVQPLVERLRGAEYALFEDSAHLAMAEEPERYLSVVESFLGCVEASRT
jgi:L-proline amide hydrolase